MRSSEQGDPEIDISHATGELPSPDDIGLMNPETLAPLKKLLKIELETAQKEGNTAKQAKLEETLGLIEQRLGDSK